MTGPPQISFAAEEAEEMGLALGDTMTVNILGRDITADVTSSARWISPPPASASSCR
jgi:predicted lysophospholipase L1 biosynthesis ABC-type transport system permease subunit